MVVREEIPKTAEEIIEKNFDFSLHTQRNSVYELL